MVSAKLTTSGVGVGAAGSAGAGVAVGAGVGVGVAVTGELRYLLQDLDCLVHYLLDQD